MNYPRVLILNCNFNHQEGAGVTVSNLFRNWPLDKIANAALNLIVDEIKCTKYYQLNVGEIKNVRINDIDEKIRILDKNRKKNIVTNALVGAKNLLELYGLYNKINLTQDFLNWIRDFNPDIIYAVSFTTRDIPFLTLLHKKCIAPLVLHVYDDWVNCNRNGIFDFIVGPITRSRFSKLYKNAEINFCISDKMSLAYETRYKKKNHVFHNPVDLKEWSVKKGSNDGVYNIVFIGTIGEHNYKEFKMLFRALNKVDYKVSITLYGSIRKQYIYDDLKTRKDVCIKGLVEYKKVPSILSEADLLFLPLSFAKNQEKYIRYSMPTKMTEYMATRIPILVFAPEKFALSEFVTRNNCAHIITIASEQELMKEITRIIENADNEIIGNAISELLKNHTIEVVQTRLLNILGAIIK